MNTTITYPLRPTLLVLAGDDLSAASLAEWIARIYEENKSRLTQAFSRRGWGIPVISMNDPSATAKAWESMENVQMAILTGYNGSDSHRGVLEKMTTAVNPVSVLLARPGYQSDPALFSKSVSLLTDSIEDQFLTAHQAMRDARDENAWPFEAPPPPSPSHSMH